MVFRDCFEGTGGARDDDKHPSSPTPSRSRLPSKYPVSERPNDLTRSGGVVHQALGTGLTLTCMRERSQDYRSIGGKERQRGLSSEIRSSSPSAIVPETRDGECRRQAIHITWYSLVVATLPEQVHYGNVQYHSPDRGPSRARLPCQNRGPCGKI